MRGFLLLLAIGLVGCDPTATGKPPPLDRLYFPTGLAFAPGADAGEGFLYVASSNLDKRYDFGTVAALDLARAGLPAFGAPVPAGGPTKLPTLPIADGGVVTISSFAGELGAFTLADGGMRLFVPSRSEGQRLQVIDAAGPRLSCGSPEVSDCSAAAPSLVLNERTETGLPRATSPYGVGVSSDGQVFVSVLDAIDSPPGSAANLHAYVLQFDARHPAVTDESFLSVPYASNGIAVGSRYVFLSGRFNSLLDRSGQPYRLVTLVDRVTHRVLEPLLEQTFRVQDARGIALSADETRLYVAARFPDTLLIIDVAGAGSSEPALKTVRAVPLPEGPNQVKVLARPGQGDLVAVTCSTAGSVVLYDAEVGDLVAQISSVGDQPFGIATRSVGQGARLFVTNFADGRVAVIDVPDLLRPGSARVVARLGPPQTCLTQPKDASCQGVAQ